MLGDDGPDPVFLLGAGASVKSGIPPAGDLAAMASKWAYCEGHGFAHQDPQVTRSDWYPWLTEQSWFDEAAELVEQYPRIIEQLLRPRENRRDFFLEALKCRTSPSPGYEALAELVMAGLINTVLTPNFDDFIPAVLRAQPELRHFEVIESPSDVRLVSTAPPYPQVVFVHGSVKHYSDQNLEDETRTMSPPLRDAVRPLMRDHPLIVVGYRGAEPSIMVDLLREGAEAADNYRRGVYWCARTNDASQLHPLVRKLAESLGPNFQLVPIEGFDECMCEWAQGAAADGRRRRQVAPSAPPPVADLEPAELGLDALDWPRVAQTLRVYAERLGQDLPAGDDQARLARRMVELDLAVSQGEDIVPTRAGALLFAAGAATTVELRHEGAVIPVRGNLTRVLARVTELIDEINAPFRLKGPTSQDVRPFEPAAIKEVLVNALVHRDHSSPDPVRIDISRHQLQVSSPGGLVSQLRPERLGHPGEKAYRNPVLADVFYGTGVMDKAGSGLADVKRWSQAAGGDAVFGPNEQNSKFVAAMRGRAQQPDPETGTADPSNIERFLTNMLPVRIEATNLHVASSAERYPGRIYERHQPGALPAFFLNEGELWTFSDLDDEANPLAAEVYGRRRTVAVSELLGDKDRERLLVQMLNRMLHRHGESMGLVVHRKSRRIWFPRDDGDQRVVTYQARVRQATRRVTKALPRRKDGTRRWEHEALRFSFRRYGDSWMLHLVPSWVFTDDGREKLMRGPKVAKLATRRAARDYNPQVANHLYFWKWVLTGGDDTVVLDPESRAVVLLGDFLTLDAYDIPTAVGGLAGPDHSADIDQALASLDEDGDEGLAA